MDSVEPDTKGYVEKDGVKIYYEYYGKRDRPAILLQNGIAMHTGSWAQFIPPLLKWVDILVWDYRGQGQSTSDNNQYSVEDFSDYLKLIVDTLQLQPKYVNPVGVSFGSFVTADFIRKYPESANKAVISGTYLTRDLGQHFQAQVGKKVLERGHIDIWVDSLYTQLFSSTFLEQIQDYIPKMKDALNERYKDRATSLWHLLDAQDRYGSKVEEYHSEFAKVKTPVLLIAGEHDNLTVPHKQKAIRRVFPKVKYKELPKCGHLVFMEQTKPFFGSVIRFIK